MHPYERDCWKFQRSETKTVELKFVHELLGPVQVSEPLFFVNREARSIALRWIHKQGLRIRSYEDGKGVVFERAFEPGYDVLYVPLDKHHAFCYIVRQIDRNFTYGPALLRIAVPGELLKREGRVLPEAYKWLSQLEVVFVIDNWEEVNMQQRWGFESTQQRAFYNPDHCRFELRSGETIDEEALYSLIEDYSQGLKSLFLDIRDRRFEIDLVDAVRR